MGGAYALSAGQIRRRLLLLFERRIQEMLMRWLEDPSGRRRLTGHRVFESERLIIRPYSVPE